MQDAVWYQGKLWLTFNDARTPMGDNQPRSCFRLDLLDTTASTALQDVVTNGRSVEFNISLIETF
jgi:hypothetical protein